MATIIKSEWHQVEKRYKLEITLDDVMAAYDIDENEAQEIYDQIVAGEYDIQQFIEDAGQNNIWLDFEWMDEDDWWTDRKGGYEVTYEVYQEETDPEDEIFIKQLEEIKATYDKLVAKDNKDKK